MGRRPVVLAPYEAKYAERFTGDEEDEPGEWQERAQADRVQDLSERAGATTREHGLGRGNGPRPGSEGGSGSDQNGGDDEEGALPKARRRGVADEAPYDVIGIDEVGEKGEQDDELVSERLVAVLEAGRLHAVRFPSMSQRVSGVSSWPADGDRS